MFHWNLQISTNEEKTPKQILIYMLLKYANYNTMIIETKLLEPTQQAIIQMPYLHTSIIKLL